MAIPFIGETLSLASALAWAAAVVLYRKSRADESALALNVFKSAVAVALLAGTIAAAQAPFVPDQPFGTWARLAVSGMIGISLADTLFFLALSRIGAGMAAVVDAFYAPSVVVLSFVFLDERLGALGLLGALMIVGAILVGAAGAPARGRERRDVVIGFVLGTVAILCMAASIVMVKGVLDGAPVLWASSVRVFFGGVGLLPALAARSVRRETARLLRPDRSWRFTIPAAALGNYFAMVAWIGGTKYTAASAAAILNQTSTVFIFLFAAVFLKEALTRRRAAALTLAFGGAALVVLR